jgi:hypothetical protein
MQTVKKITILRHNLMGIDADHQGDENIVNEIYYDDEGNETERLNYNFDGELEEHIIVKYENKHAVEERLEIDGVVTERTTRIFDDKGRVMTEERHYMEGGSDVISFTYEGDNLVLRQVVDTDEEEGEKEVWEYEDNKLRRTVAFNMFGNVELEKSYEYNDDGLLSEITETSFRDELPEKVVSIFNEKGNLTVEKRYDNKGRLVARTTVHYHENDKPHIFEEENVRGKKVTTLEYDEAGNNITREENDQNGQRVSYVERTFDESGNMLSAEVIMEPSLNNQGQHYKLEYKYEY